VTESERDLSDSNLEQSERGRAHTDQREGRNKGIGFTGDTERDPSLQNLAGGAMKKAGLCKEGGGGGGARGEDDDGRSSSKGRQPA
jgi:hypothetical protein